MTKPKPRLQKRGNVWGGCEGEARGTRDGTEAQRSSLFELASSARAVRDRVVRQQHLEHHAEGLEVVPQRGVRGGLCEAADKQLARQRATRVVDEPLDGIRHCARWAAPARELGRLNVFATDDVRLHEDAGRRRLIRGPDEAKVL